jgi:hypothetical protein
MITRTTHTIRGSSCQVTVEIKDSQGPEDQKPVVTITCQDLSGVSWVGPIDGESVQEASSGVEWGLLRRYHRDLEMSRVNAPLARLAEHSVPIIPEALEMEQRVNRENLDFHLGRLAEAEARIRAWGEVQKKVLACGAKES